MLRLPKELLSRIADFSQDENLPSMRLTCKLLEQNTRKHFIAAFIEEIRFAASLAGIQRLEKIVAHPKFGPCIKTFMATVTEDQSLQREECKSLLAKAFAQASCFEHGFRLGVSCRPIHDRSIRTAQLAVNFAWLMLDAKPSESLLKRFSIDLHQLPPNDDRTLADYLWYFSGAMSTSLRPLIQSDMDILLLNPDRAMNNSLDPRWTITECGTCIGFNDLKRGCDLLWAQLLWPRRLSVKKVQIKNCKFSIDTLRLLLSDTKSSSWNLELKNCHFDDPSPWSNTSSSMLKDILCNRDSGLNSCFLSNLTSQSGPIFAGDFEASNPHEIRERISNIEFFEQNDVDEEAN